MEEGEVAALLHHYLAMAEEGLKDSGLDGSQGSGGSSLTPLSPWERLVRSGHPNKIIMLCPALLPVTNLQKCKWISLLKLDYICIFDTYV